MTIRRNVSILIGLMVMALAVSACDTNLNDLKGSGNVKTETREVSGFTGVKLQAIGDMTITVGEDESLVIAAEDNILEKITSKVSGGVLEVGFDGGFNIVPTKSIRYTITVPSLDKLEIEGAGSVHVSGVDSDRLRVKIDGAGDITITGKAADQDITINGTGSYNGFDLESDTVKVDINGAASVNVNAADELTVNIDGAGSVIYTGDPHVKPTINGLGTIQQR